MAGDGTVAKRRAPATGTGGTSPMAPMAVSPLPAPSSPLATVGSRALSLLRRGQRSSTFNTETYASLPEIPFRSAQKEPLSTFSIDVDTASYANVRRLLESGDRVPPGAVRIEEMINYFSYDYPAPVDGRPFSVNTATSNGRPPILSF
jgi:von Willebrand factor